MAANLTNSLLKQSYSNGFQVGLGNFSDNTSTPHPNSTLSTSFQFPDPPYPPGGIGVLAFMAAVTSLFTTTGNILVVVSFIVDHRLRQPSNYLIASLAVTDILIGMFSMPFYSLYLLKKYWPLGQTLCDLWLSMDYTVCLVSQYTVFLITLDRFCSVKAPAKYRNWRTKRKMKIMIAATWLFPAFIFFTSIMGWRAFTGSEPPKDFSCDVEFRSHQLFTVILVISYYWVTLIIMFGLYIGIYQVAWSLHARSKAKRTRISHMKHLSNNNCAAEGIRSRSTAFATTNGTKAANNNSKYSTKRANSKVHEREDTSDLSNDLSSNDSSCSKMCENNDPDAQTASNNGQSDTFEQDTILSESPLWKPRKSFESESIHWDVFNERNSGSVEAAEVGQLIDDTDGSTSEVQEVPAEIQSTKQSSEFSKNKLFTQISVMFAQLRKVNWCKRHSSSDGNEDANTNGPRKKSKNENRAYKALRTISFILGAFVLCWTPYHVVVIVYSFCPSCVNLTFYDFTYWLCYMNSPLNPFCYALSNQQFKCAFIKILKGDYFKGRAYFQR